MAFSAFSVMPFSAFAAEEYDVWVGGTRVTSEKKDDIPPAPGFEEYSGEAIYEGETNTLYLNYYSYNGNGFNGAAIYWASSETLNIVILGMNRLGSNETNSEGCVYGIRAESGSVEISTRYMSYSEQFGGVDIANTADPDTVEKDYGVYAKGGVTVDGASFYSRGTLGKNNYGIYADSVTAEDKAYITAAAGEGTGESIGVCLNGNLTLSDECGFFEVSGFSRAVEGAASSKAVIPADAVGWAKADGSGNGVGFSPAEYSVADFGSCKKLMLPVEKSGQLGDNVYYSNINDTAYVYGSGEIWDFDWDTNCSPFCEPDFSPDSGSQPDPVDPDDVENNYTLELISEADAEANKTLVDDIVITGGITRVGNCAFSNNAYYHVTLPDTVTSIGERAFYPNQLHEVLLPDSVTSLGKEAFGTASTSYDSPMTFVRIPGSVETVPQGAFGGNENIASVAIGKGVKKIEMNAFNECTALTDVYFSGTQAEWEEITVESGNAPLLNANIHFNEPGCGSLGSGMLITSDIVCSNQAATVKIMMSGNRIGEKVLLYPDDVGSGYSLRSRYIPFTEYNPSLDCSIAVTRVMYGTPGSHAIDAEYIDGGGTVYRAEDAVTVDKYNTRLEKPEDRLILTGEDVNYIINIDDDATGEVRLFLTKGDETVKYIPDDIADGVTKITISGLAAGEYVVTVNYYGDDNYFAVGTTAKLTVREPLTASIENTEIEYGDALPDALKACYVTAGGQTLTKAEAEAYGLPETLPFTSNYKQFDNVGAYTLSVNEEEVPESYRLAFADSALTVKKAPLTITAKQQDYDYNGLDQGPGDTAYDDVQEIAKLITAEGLKGTDAVTSITVDGQGKNADTYELIPKNATVNGKNEAQGNYSITYVNGVLKINPKAVTVTVHGDEVYMPYNSTERVYNGKVACAFDPEILTDYDEAKFSYTGSTTVKGTNAGNYETKLSTDKCAYNDSNYTITWVAGSPIRLHVSPSALDITANNKETNHGSDLAELTYTIDNLHSCYYNEDELNISISTNADKNKPGTYEITVSCEDNPNYAVRTFSGTYTVGDSPHTWSDVTYEWTGTSSVTASRKCIYCDETEAETVATSSKETKAPTCTENGETTYTATFTNSVFETQTRTEADVVALGHQYGKEGEDRYTCTLCGAVDEALKKACAEKDKAEFTASVSTTPEDDGATVAWKKAPEAKRYVIYATYCGKKSKYRKIKTVKGNITSFKLKKLNGKKINTKKNLKVYIVAQKKVNGKWVKLFKTPTFHTAGKNSKYTNVKKIKVKKAKFVLKQGKTAKIKAKLVLVDKKKKPIHHVKTFRYMSTNTAVVKVTKSGKIKAVGKGTATVYVFSNNGTPKAIKVTVK